VFLLFPPSAPAQDPTLAYIHALQEQGYGDVAVDYLKTLQQGETMPSSLGDIWDLEMSRSLNAAARDAAYTSEDADKLSYQAQEFLSKFLQDHPDHPEALAALGTWGNFSRDRGLKYIRQAGETSNEKQKAKLYNDAREALQDARVKYKDALEKLQTRLATMPASKKTKPKTDKKSDPEPSPRDKLLETIESIHFQDALLSYYLAQTYPNPKDAARLGELRQAAKAFDDIFQRHRLEQSNLSLLCHMWEGKCREELGDLETALDIYDEVLARPLDLSATAAQRDVKLESLIAQVEQLRLRIVKKKSFIEYVSEATEWMKVYRKLNMTEGYQGLAMDLVENLLAQSMLVKTTREKNKHIADAMDVARDMMKIRGPYQKDFVLLYRKFAKSGGGTSEAKTLEEAVALAETAATAGQWEDAEANYAKALQFAEKTKPGGADRTAALREGLANAVFQQAREMIAAGKLEEAITAAGKVLDEYKNTSAAPMASALRVAVALNLFASAPAEAKEDALKRLTDFANFTIANWPGKPEADDARMNLGQAALVQDKPDEALKVFEAINPKSDRYPVAMLLAAKVYWNRYITARTGTNKVQAAADRQKAVKLSTESLAVQRKKLEADKALPKALIETQLLLAETEMEANKPEQAAALLQPLFDALKTAKTEDNVSLRIFASIIKAHLAAGDLEKAASVGAAVAELGADAPNVNAELLNVVRKLETQRLDAEKTIAQTTSVQQIEAAKSAQDSAQAKLDKIVPKLIGRKQLNPAGMVYVADMQAAAGSTAASRDLYEQVVKLAMENSVTAREYDKAVTRARSQLIGLLAKEGKYDEAARQAEELLKTHPNSLEPQMELGRIWQARAEKQPAHYKEAVAQWTKLRDMLKRSTTTLPEYYEASSCLAECLLAQATQSADKAAAAEKAQQAAKILEADLFLNPNLNGPATAAKYKALKQKASEILSRKDAGKKSGI
jgi:cellulose synthase operon protein C